GYSEYEYQQPGISADTITEISEQIASEKMSDIRKYIEKIMDFRTTTETKIELMEEKLKRIEKIMDTLQSSVLRKVGDYITNVDDIKKELIETQKTFSKIAGTKYITHHKHSTSEFKVPKPRKRSRKK
ncbi:MAG: hypothetical protein IH948_10755, partial [Bacteroidetes bacterium]|nr:hypothetical protein [Bacteroidota bacterium]